VNEVERALKDVDDIMWDLIFDIKEGNDE
jgi:hypothetical protein